MTTLQEVLIISLAVPYTIFSMIIMATDFSNESIPLPKDFYADGYNWFGSWFLFILRILVGFPFYIIGSIVYLMYKFIKWLFTVGR